MAATAITNPTAGSGLGAFLRGAGAPSAGTNAVQTITIDATGGTFKLAFGGYVTAAISWSATNATLVSNIDTALEALPSIGTGGVVTAVGTMTAGVGTIAVTFSGTALQKLAVGLITVNTNSLTGTATLSIANTTPGVTATGRGSTIGASYVDTTNGILYSLSGSVTSPTWTKVSGT